MQFMGRPASVGIIFDCDMSTPGDALAMALLYGLDGKNEARVASVSVSRHNLEAAAFAEVIGRFYAGAVSGAFGSFSRTLPVAMSIAGKPAPSLPMLASPLAKKDAAGNPAYAHGIEKLNDTAEAPALIRNALTAQQDQNAIVVLAGPATNLVTILDLPGVKELIARKVRYLVVSGGAFPEGTDENIAADRLAAKKLFAEWPSPIVACGREAAEIVPYPASSIDKDFAWTPNHPVADAYRAFKPMPYDLPVPDMLAVLHAVRPKETYLQLSPPGAIEVLDDGRTRFTPSASGKHRYLIPDLAQKDRLLAALIELAGAKPVPRQPRFRRPDQQQQQQQQQTPPPKPEPAKTP
jgi:purine nucleosidase